MVGFFWAWGAGLRVKPFQPDLTLNPNKKPQNPKTPNPKPPSPKP